MKKLANRFLVGYIVMFVISTLILLAGFMLLDAANHAISGTLVKDRYTAASLMQDDYQAIDAAPVVAQGGGMQVIDAGHAVVRSVGLDALGKAQLTAGEFTDFLVRSQRKGIPYSHSIQYNEAGRFWLVVTFPSSFRIDFALAYNPASAAVDRNRAVGAIGAIALFYLALLAVCTVIYAKITSVGIRQPLSRLADSARRLRDGDYSARADLKVKNEIGDLQDAFNTMAGRIEQEISARRQSEESRKQLVLDISHDLKNPLASVVGYAEFCLSRPELPPIERETYLKVIRDSGIRANRLITDLFELSRLESPEFSLDKTRLDLSEYLRELIGKMIPMLDDAGFSYAFDIPECEIGLDADPARLERVFHNLLNNTVQYNPPGTHVRISLAAEDASVTVLFKDDGRGIPADIARDIFKPFVRGGTVRNVQAGSTGLGLAIVEKIVAAHGGTVRLETEEGQGCAFTIQLPRNGAVLNNAGLSPGAAASSINRSASLHA